MNLQTKVWEWREKKMNRVRRVSVVMRVEWGGRRREDRDGEGEGG
jgi:hypothetical protein